MKAINFEGQAQFPTKIICVGKNYAEHIKELNEEAAEQPVIFIKPNSAIADKVFTHHSDEIHYEAEISFLVNDNQYVAVAIGLDLTRRLVQKQLKTKGLPWERAKAFDNSAVFSDFVTLASPISELRMEFWINGQLIQHACYELMLTKPLAVLSEIQTFLSLEDGDVIMTGTPKGVGKINTGDEFHGKLFDKEKLLVEQCWIAQ